MLAMTLTEVPRTVELEAEPTLMDRLESIAWDTQAMAMRLELLAHAAEPPGIPALTDAVLTVAADVAALLDLVEGLTGHGAA